MNESDKQLKHPDVCDQEIDQLVNDPDVRAVLDVLKDIIVNDGIDLCDLPDRTARSGKNHRR
jgi:hypothetical protein